MQKKILAAVVASMMAGQAMAVTVVDDGTNKATIGGYLDLRYVDQGDNKGHMGDSSRINFAFEHKMTEATTVFAKAEWGFDTDGSKDDFFWQRQAYVGAMNDQLGSITYGQQWSSYGKVAGYTDQFAAAGGDASGYYGDDGDFLGTARAEDALQYNHSFMGLNISAQMQVGKKTESATVVNMDNSFVVTDTVTTDVERDGSYAIAASYDLPMGFSIGAAYNQAKVNGTVTEVTSAPVTTVEEDNFKAKSTIVGAKFEADKIYAAVTYAKLKNRAVLDGVEKAEGVEFYASYQLNEMFKVEGGYNQLKDESSNPGKAEIKHFPMAVVYTQGPVQLSGTYQFEKSTDKDGKDVDDKMVLQARYYF
ncbi:porin [Salinisphaera sp. G21_0]|uniref:porin n=1 Tax=Salinisphaera sp. G21_0 TaxID=2821094 RepID=UPI001AD9C66B|nr:porin [Salinisphaera sp. G21_0]MBO9482147.1 porin [Salinisphaera sp. G21_0]